MRNPARFPLKEGLHSRQAHADLPEQAIYEREVGREGFFGPASHIHHKHPITSIKSKKTHYTGHKKLAQPIALSLDHQPVDIY